jgi:hypothetical protein
MEEVTDEEFHRFFSNEYQRRCAAYVAQIDAWRAALSEEQVFVGRFDDIISRPEDYLLEVMRFLGITAKRRYISGSVADAVNATGEGPVPEGHRRFLEKLLAADIEALRQRLGMSWD